MTRNTKIHKFKTKDEREILFRDLTANELAFLDGIKNETYRYDFAGRIALYGEDHKNIEWPILLTIGEKAIAISKTIYSDDIIFEMSVKDIRENLENDFILTSISFILKILPGQSYTDLLNLTPKDLIELVCVCEKILGKPLLDFSDQQKKSKLVNPNTLSPDQSKNLKQEIAKLNSTYGIPR